MDYGSLIDDLFSVVEKVEKSVRPSPPRETDTSGVTDLQTPRGYRKGGNSESE
jgi:hypothetical protein